VGQKLTPVQHLLLYPVGRSVSTSGSGGVRVGGRGLTPPENHTLFLLVHDYQDIFQKFNILLQHKMFIYYKSLL